MVKRDYGYGPYGPETYGRGKGKLSLVVFLLYVLLGIYLLNIQFVFVNIPSQISEFNNWIVAVSGIFLIIGGINYLRIKK